MVTAQITANIMDKFDLRAVREYRKQQALTQAELAEKANIRRQTLIVWETTPIQQIDAKLIGSVARALGVSVWDIIQFVDIPDESLE